MTNFEKIKEMLITRSIEFSDPKYKILSTMSKEKLLEVYDLSMERSCPCCAEWPICYEDGEENSDEKLPLPSSLPACYGRSCHSMRLKWLDMEYSNDGFVVASNGHKEFIGDIPHIDFINDIYTDIII